MSEPARRSGTIDGPVAVLTLNRPERRNALSRALVAELGDALDAHRGRAGVRAVVLTGAGPTFCSGMDLKEASRAGRPGPRPSERPSPTSQAIADLIDQLHQFPKPTIAALNGDALRRRRGAGPGLRLRGRRRRAPGSATPRSSAGLVAAIVMHDLVRQVGDRRARELLLTGEPIDAAEAERWGLINRVVAGRRVPRRGDRARPRSLLGVGPVGR